MNNLTKLLSSDYGMLGALIGLCLFRIITYEEQQPVGLDGANQLLDGVIPILKSGTVVIAGKGVPRERVTHELKRVLEAKGWTVEAVISEVL